MAQAMHVTERLRISDAISTRSLGRAACLELQPVRVVGGCRCGRTLSSSRYAWFRSIARSEAHRVTLYWSMMGDHLCAPPSMSTCATGIGPSARPRDAAATTARTSSIRQRRSKLARRFSGKKARRNEGMRACASATLVTTACLARFRLPHLCATPPAYSIRPAEFPADIDFLCDVRPPTAGVMEDGAIGCEREIPSPADTHCLGDDHV